MCRARSWVGARVWVCGMFVLWNLVGVVRLAGDGSFLWWLWIRGVYMISRTPSVRVQTGTSRVRYAGGERRRAYLPRPRRRKTADVRSGYPSPAGWRWSYPSPVGHSHADRRAPRRSRYRQTARVSATHPAAQSMRSQSRPIPLVGGNAVPTAFREGLLFGVIAGAILLLAFLLRRERYYLPAPNQLPAKRLRKPACFYPYLAPIIQHWLRERNLLLPY
ncbi:MAG: hypothetical protein KatS3mg022_0810 [Armatimonadota bacterium]|nr:MAG: hypothetical protein KatS3mg022_0810 [Armatimonadota bacterium]